MLPFAPSIRPAWMWLTTVTKILCAPWRPSATVSAESEGSIRWENSFFRPFSDTWIPCRFIFLFKEIYTNNKKMYTGLMKKEIFIKSKKKMVWNFNLWNAVLSRYVESFLHSLGNYTRRAIFPETCKINQSSVDFHCKPLWSLWLDWFSGFVPPDLFLRGAGLKWLNITG